MPPSPRSPLYAAPRPFYSRAVLCWHQRIDVPRGYMPGMSGPGYYLVKRRRRPAVALRRGRAAMINARRSSRVYWRLCPPITCEVA